MHCVGVGGLDGGVEGADTNEALPAMLTVVSALCHGPKPTATGLNVYITECGD